MLHRAQAIWLVYGGSVSSPSTHSLSLITHMLQLLCKERNKRDPSNVCLCKIVAPCQLVFLSTFPPPLPLADVGRPDFPADPDLQPAGHPQLLRQLHHLLHLRGEVQAPLLPHLLVGDLVFPHPTCRSHCTALLFFFLSPLATAPGAQAARRARASSCCTGRPTRSR